jgi:hypothetical protein
MPCEKYLQLRQEGKLTVEAKKVVVSSVENAGVTWVFALIEPEIIEVVVPIGGSLTPGTGHRYGPYSSCVAIAVSVTWTPGDQALGILIADADTGEGYGYFYTGGSAYVQFSTDWTRSYYILIASIPDNTKDITYSGTIRLYIW